MNTARTDGPASAAPLVENAAQAILAPAVAHNPDGPAVRDRAGVWTYAELDAASRAFEGELRRLGVKPGDRVLVRAGSVREFTAMLYGTWRLGAVFVPISFAMRTFHLRSVIADSEPALIVATAAERDGVEGFPWPGGVPVRVLEDLDFTATELADSDAPAAAPVPADRLALLIYTSGSTAAPKGVACPHAPVVFAARAIADRLEYQPDDVVLTAVPLSFDYGLYQVLLCALARAELLLSDADGHARLLGYARDHGATVLPLVPSLGEVLVRLAARDPRPTRLRLFTNTGAALNAPLIAALRESFPGAKVAPMFGTTECKRITVLEPDGDLERPGSVGPALPGTEVLILDEDGQALPAGDVGEIAVRGPHVMAGYWRAPEVTAQRFRTGADGTVTLHTGDYGWLDADGHLYFQGRRDDLFKRRGLRMSAIEIEAATLDVTGVREAALLVPEAGRDMVLFVVGDALTPEDVLLQLADRLEQAKVPEICHMLQALPLTPNGKTDRKRLKALLDGEFKEAVREG
ncbi:class I adenylate-forming enzyme family protein [Streptomyces albidus (ex Kaewkla and Franco 2022)]|uniref:class I adenylate-forming enzyme family protein n=1 Tax=Streptomyces albidus (ex Kaewkla and Franco 2022) TaxID=722709 RepID=UPI0015EF9E68|nr:AMP-binding protein [Streptomyces albidus (ex Kaewkla and Franco 2022)]